MTALAFVALVLLSALYDVLTLSWHRARESGHVTRTIIVGCAMEAVGAIPLIIAIELGEWWPVAAGIVGSALGTWIGMRRAAPAR